MLTAIVGLCLLVAMPFVLACFFLVFIPWRPSAYRPRQPARREPARCDDPDCLFCTLAPFVAGVIVGDVFFDD